MAKRKSPHSVAVATRRSPKKLSRARIAVAVSNTHQSAAASLYSVHPGVAKMQKWIAELKPRTGCSLEQWIAHIQVRGPKDLNECRQWLQEKHRLGTNSAWWLAEKALGNPHGLSDDDPEAYLAACPGYVDNMYAGAKAALRPI